MINVIKQITRQNKWGSLNMITWKKLIRKCNFVVQSSKARAVKSIIDYQKFQTVSTFTFKGIFAKSSFLTFWGHHAISKFKQRFFVTYPIIQASRWRISYVVCITEKSSLSHKIFWSPLLWNKMPLLIGSINLQLINGLE